jgi:exopolysaccharide biosynthesis polyprenyl glycosylphosphotransferase
MVIPQEELISTVSSHGYVQVYIAEPQLSHESILQTMSQCHLPQVEFKVLADLFTLATGSYAISNIDEIPTIEIGKSRPGFLYRITKRLFDIVGSLLLIIVSSPLWILIAICIKFETPGSVIIAQKRMGHMGKEFTLWKFRTMHVSSDLYAHPPKDGSDKRVTRVGRWLRKTSLDELPQLLNVFMGTMSLVGPRPEMPFIVETYTPWQRKRLEAKPGLTGLWQILGRKDLPLTENLHYDFYYINNQSLLLDSVILLRTIPVVLFGKGAY